jgi:membrane-associated phospholipid phosphatase
MTHRLSASLLVVVCLASPGICQAQLLDSQPVVPVGQGSHPIAGAPQPSTFRAPSADGFWAPFKSVPSDFVRFLSKDTAKIVGLVGASALVASRWDGQSIDGIQGMAPSSRFEAGNIAGRFVIQAGAGFGLYAIARLADNQKLAAVGGDLVRAQILSQGIVQVGKMMTQRQRPDGSNSHSLPSGHTASAFATATVLQRHFGWKAGIPAYGFGAYVAAARLSANKHNLSDVLMGAAIGIAAGRTVTVGVGGAKFDMGVAPTLGGAAITFTKRQ